MPGTPRYVPFECIYCESVMRVSDDYTSDTLIECPNCKRGFKAKLAFCGSAPIARTFELPPSVAGQPAESTDADPGRSAVPTGRLGGQPTGNLNRPLPASAKRLSGADTEPVAASPIAPIPHVPPTTEPVIQHGPPTPKRRDRRNDIYRPSIRPQLPASELESNRSWNDVDVDGRSKRRKRAKIKDLQEHDGGEGGWRELVIILLGGLISLPITQICLWWLVHTDPLQLGPPVSEVAPQVVPVEFRSAAIEE